MNERNDIGDVMVASYVLGVLDAPERRAVETRAVGDERLTDALTQWQERLMPLVLAMPSVSVPAGVWHSIADALDYPDAEGPHTRAAQGGVWLRVVDGVSMKLLSVDPVSGARSAVMRLAAGSVLDGHPHEETEECYVIEGHIEIAGEHLRTGDHHVAPAGTVHGRLMAHENAVLFLHWA